VEIFAQVSEIEAAQRAEYIYRQTDDPDLRREVLSLLGVEPPQKDILERPALEWCSAEPNSEANPPLPRLAPGELLADRFEITSFLGSGGMGEVYAADDHALGERVALKVLRPDLAAEPAYLERFRREIRLARRISHPNVARVFDLSEDQRHPLGPVTFYVMELLDGQTLAFRLREQGPIPEAEARNIARQLAQGLSAAHDAGVIHRDFKPSNVMLLEQRAVVTDFGLAAPIKTGAPEADLRTTSILLGTPGYVAPEQWAGKPPTFASDVYAFGVVLHEIITGQHPNSTTLYQVPPNWARAIRKCLEMDPRGRWRSPLDAVAAVEPRLLSRRNALIASGAAGCMSLAAVGVRLLVRGTRPVRGSNVVIADIQNATGDARFDAIGTALRMQMDQSTYLNQVDSSRMHAALQQMLIAADDPISPAQYREVAWRMNASMVVFGNVTYVGTTPNLTLEMEWRGSGPQTPSNRMTKSFSARSSADLLALARDAANWIRESVGDLSRLEALYDRLPEDVTTGSWEALVFYSKAEQFEATQKRDEALLQLESALRADPQFTLAAARRADILNSSGRESEAIQAWQEVLQSLRKRRISRREELHALGMSAFDCGNYVEADNRFAQWASEYPSDPRGYVYRNTPLLMANRPQESALAIEAALHCDPDYLTGQVHRAQCAIALGDRILLDRSTADLMRLGVPQFAHLMESLFCFAQADLLGAAQAASKLREGGPIRFQYEARLRLAMVFAEAGRMDLAGRALQRGLSLPLEAGSTRQRANALLGAAYCGVAVTGSFPQEWLEVAIAVRQGPTTLTHAAIASSRAGRHSEAAAYLQRLHQLPRAAKCQFGEALAEAEILTASGRLPEANKERELAAGFTAPYHAAPQATLSTEWTPDRVRKQVCAAALQWTDPFVPELGAWGRTTRHIPISPTDLNPESRKLRRFQAAMAALSSNPQPFLQPGDLA
jgi:serine/threonine protein kinase/tetratricopeptide (TPR) repeat protein